MSKEAGAATEDAAVENTETPEATESTEETWDEERAKATILKQRESEKAAKDEAAALREELAKYKTAEEEELEAQKALEVKVSERDGTIEALNKRIANIEVKHDFLSKAQHEQGIADPELAYLAAKEQGFLGDYGPKEGKVGEHDFEALGDAYPSFKGSTSAKTGDAGVRGKGKTLTPGDQFNRAIRSRISG